MATSPPAPNFFAEAFFLLVRPEVKLVMPAEVDLEIPVVDLRRELRVATESFVTSPTYT